MTDTPTPATEAELAALEEMDARVGFDDDGFRTVLSAAFPSLAAAIREARMERDAARELATDAIAGHDAMKERYDVAIRELDTAATSRAALDADALVLANEAHRRHENACNPRETIMECDWPACQAAARTIAALGVKA